MVAILEKSEHNVNFHSIVDFVEASHLRIETTEKGTKILATIDGNLRTIFESSIRRNLKLNDETGISSLPDAKLFENLTLMGYNISPNQKFTFQKDEPAFPLRDVSQGEACPTISSLDVEQDRANIAKTSTLYHESTSRVPSLAADEGKRSGDDAPIKGRRLDEGEEAAEKGSNNTEEMINVLTSMDAATVLSSRVAEVPTGSGSIPTVGPPAAEVPTGSGSIPTAGLPAAGVPTGSDVFPLLIMIDGLDMSNETIAKYLQEYHQFATELPIERRIELISNLVRYQDNYAKVHKYQTQQRKPLTKKQQREFYTSVLRNQAGWKAKDFKGMTLEEIKENFDPVWKQIHDFIPISSKEEAKRFKRKGIRFEQESVKKLKTSKEMKANEEVPKEKVNEMIQLIHIEELDREDLNQLWRLMKESLSIRPASSHKEMELWVELKRLYEPDDEDQLWTHTQNIIERLPTQKRTGDCDDQLQASSRNYSQMASDLILKIYKIANHPRQEDD
nr:hypothetical protein [Tanacetum cinerariifolium]